MKKNLFFAVLAVLLCIGFSSCKPNEKEYSCFFKVEAHEFDTEDSLLEAELEEEYMFLIRAYADVFNADRWLTFVLVAADEEELKTKISELNQKVDNQIANIDMKNSYTVNFYLPKNEKEYTSISSNIIGTPMDQSSDNEYEIFNLINEEGLDTKVPMNKSAGQISDLALDNWGSEEFKYPTYNCVIKADLNRNAGGAYIYIHGKCNKYSWYSTPITDVIVLHASGARGNDFTYKYQGRTYHRANPYDDNLTGDLNQGCGGPYLYLMYTKDNYDSRRLVNMCIYSGNYDFRIPASDIGGDMAPVPMINESNGKVEDSQADFNMGVGGDWIRMLCKYW